MLHFQSQDDDKRSHDLMSKLSFKLSSSLRLRLELVFPLPVSQIRFPTLQNLASNLTSSELDVCFIQWKTSRFARSIDVTVSSLRGCWQSDEELVLLVLNCIQLTSQEFDCVYEIIWCQKHCFTMGPFWRPSIQVTNTTRKYSPSRWFSTRRGFTEGWETFLQVRS